MWNVAAWHARDEPDDLHIQLDSQVESPDKPRQRRTVAASASPAELWCHKGSDLFFDIGCKTMSNKSLYPEVGGLN